MVRMRRVCERCRSYHTAWRRVQPFQPGWRPCCYVNACSSLGSPSLARAMHSGGPARDSVRRPDEMGAALPLVGSGFFVHGLLRRRNSAVVVDSESLSIRSLSCRTRSVPCSARLGSLQWRIWSCLSSREPRAHSPVGESISSRDRLELPLCVPRTPLDEPYIRRNTTSKALMMQRFDTRTALVLEWAPRLDGGRSCRYATRHAIHVDQRFGGSIWTTTPLWSFFLTSIVTRKCTGSYMKTARLCLMQTGHCARMCGTKQSNSHE